MNFTDRGQKQDEVGLQKLATFAILRRMMSGCQLNQFGNTRQVRNKDKKDVKHFSNTQTHKQKGGPSKKSVLLGNGIFNGGLFLEETKKLLKQSIALFFLLQKKDSMFLEEKKGVTVTKSFLLHFFHIKKEVSRLN